MLVKPKNLFSVEPCFAPRLVWSEGLGNHKIRFNLTGNMCGRLYMCTSRLLAAGESRKTFCTSLGEKDNELASNYKITDNSNFNSFDNGWSINNNKLFDRAVSIDSLKRAWFKLKSKPGMSIRGSNEETLSGISESWFRTTSQKLSEGSFKYPNRRRVFIDKPDGSKRPLTIANPRVKIIERAFLDAIEPHFEGCHTWTEVDASAVLNVNFKSNPDYKMTKKKEDGEYIYLKKEIISPRIFHPHSYGFRPDKSAHEALQVIKHWKTNTTFLIDYDISKAFDNVNRKRLKNLFCKHIVDVRFWTEISKLLDAGVIEDLQMIFEHIGVTQGSILSPFLFNVYMHELDNKIVSLQKATTHTHKSHESATYGNKEAELAYRKLSRNFAIENLRRSIKKYGSKEELLNARKQLYKEHHDKYGRRKGIDLETRHIQYVRYADDFLIGIVGDRKFAIQVRSDINNFIKSDLHLNLKKDHILHRNDGSVTFLGHLISLVEFKAKTTAVPKAIRAAKKHKNASIARFLAADKRLAKAKSNELKAAILRQVKNISEKMKISISHKRNVDLLSTILAYKNIGYIILKQLKSEDWNQLFELICYADLTLVNPSAVLNPALSRWANYFQEESERLNEFSAMILRDKIVSMVKSNLSENMTPSIATKVELLQSEYLKKLDDIISESSNEAVQKKRNYAIEKFKIKMMSSTKAINPEDNELLEAVEGLTILSQAKSSPRRIVVNAPISKTFAKLRLKGYVHPTKDKAVGNVLLGFYPDSEIITHFNIAIQTLLNWFSGAGNLSKVKGLAQLLRKSCVLTLANKHKKNSNWVYNVYGSEVEVRYGSKKTSLITRSTILNFPNKFNFKLKELDRFSVDKVLGKIHKLNHSLEFFKFCCVEGCEETEGIEVHHIRRLHRKTSNNGVRSIVSSSGKRVRGLGAILSSINRKQLPLCHEHHIGFESGFFYPLNYTKLNSVLNSGKPGFKLPTIKNNDFKPIFEGKQYSLEKDSMN
jgi:retron-type reverse transcriptase